MRKHVWPDDARCVVAMTVDFDGTANEVGRGLEPVGIHSAGEYSARCGVPRIMRIFEKHKIPATFFIPGFDAEQNPDLIKEIHRRGYEIASHGYLHEGGLLEPDEERELLTKTHHILTDLIGTPPKGWRNPGGNKTALTVKFLHDLGYIYDSSDKDFDFPYLIEIDGKKVEDMIQIPNNTSSLDDAPMYSRGLIPPGDVLELWKAEFDTLYQEDGYFMLTFHPRAGFGSGPPARAKVVDELIRYIKKHDGIYFTTLLDMARWCLEGGHGII